MNDWRAREADARDEEAAVFADALERLADVEAVLELRRSSGLATQSFRGFAAGLRSEATAIASEARALRAPAAPDYAMPIALTTRHVRGAL